MSKKMTMKAYHKTEMDKKADRMEAKKRGIPEKKWEGSKADERKDRAAVRKINKKRGK